MGIQGGSAIGLQERHARAPEVPYQGKWGAPEAPIRGTRGVPWQSSGMPDLNDLEEGDVDVPHELHSPKLAKAFVRTARRVQSSRSPRRL